jgi:hypothetical protein
MQNTRESVREHEERITALEQQLERIMLAGGVSSGIKKNPFGRLRHFFDSRLAEVTVYATNKTTGEEELIGEYETASRAKAVRLAKKDVDASNYKNWQTVGTPK